MKLYQTFIAIEYSRFLITIEETFTFISFLILVLWLFKKKEVNNKEVN